MGFLAILAAVLAGTLLTRLGESEDQQGPGPWERVLLGAPLGIAAWGGLTAVLWTAFGASNALSLLALAILAGLGGLCWARGGGSLQGRAPTGSQVLRWLVAPALTMVLLIGVRYLETADGLLFQGDPMTDMPVHLALAGRMAEAPGLPIDHPLLAGLPLRYHVIADLVAGASVRLNGVLAAPPAPSGIPVPFSLGELVAVFNLLDMVLAVSLAGLVGLLAFRHGLSPAGSHLAVWLFLLGGGLGFAYYWPDVPLHLNQVLPGMYTPPDRIHDWEIVWTGMLRDFVLHARATLLGLCLGVAALVRYTASRPLSRGDAVGAGLCVGLLPFSQVHSFLGTVLCIVGLWILGRRSGSAPFWLVALGLVALQAPAMLSMRQGLLTVHLGWSSTRHDLVGLALFWGLNLGVLFFVPPLVALRQGADLRRLWLASLLPFIVANVLAFTATWNNVKIMHSWYLVACLLLAYGLEQLWNRQGLLARGLSRGLALGLALLSVASGLTSLAWHSGRHANIPRSMLDYGRQVRRSIAWEETVATFPDVALVLPPYALRRVFLAQSGLSSDHGVDPAVRQEALRQLFNAATMDELVDRARTMGVALVELQPHDPGFPVNRKLIETFPLEVDGGDYRLYRIPGLQTDPGKAGPDATGPAGT